MLPLERTSASSTAYPLHASAVNGPPKANADALQALIATTAAKQINFNRCNIKISLNAAG